MPAAHDVHPEFGWLCPTLRLRRRLRLVLAGLGFAAIGVVVIWAAHRTEGGAMMVVRLDASGGAAASTDGSEPALVAAAARPRPIAAIETRAPNGACEEDSWVYLWAYPDGRCVAGKMRKARTVRAANNRPAIAASPLGRGAAPPAGAVESVAATVSGTDRGPDDRSPSKSAPAAGADAAAAAVPQPRPRPVAASKPPQRTARSQARRREPANDARSWREVRSDDWGAPGYPVRDGFREGFFSFFR